MATLEIWLPIAEKSRLAQKRPKSRCARTCQGVTCFVTGCWKRGSAKAFGYLPPHNRQAPERTKLMSIQLGRALSRSAVAQISQQGWRESRIIHLTHDCFTHE